MMSATISDTKTTESLGPNDAHSPFVARWLLATAMLVFVMVLVGGATRLTGSGLSITEWRPVAGALPPLNETDWLSEFAKYKASPQYDLLNRGMEIAEFKFIYWWEWGHRQLGRFIGLVFAGGLLLAAATRSISTRLGVILFGMGLVLAMQGAIGWIMVASGLQPGMISVAPVKLTLHLAFACLFLAGIVFIWARIRLARDLEDGPRAAAIVLWLLVFVQILLGGIVAGSRAGFTYNTWPLMDGVFIPPAAKLFVVSPWLENFVDNPTLVQFNHRMFGYLVVAVAIAFAVLLRRKIGRAPSTRRFTSIAGGAFLQMLLGITTLLLGVPIWAGLAHQALAILILADATRNIAQTG